MKLSLPLPLRASLLAALAVLGTTLTSAVTVGGLITLALASQAAAADPIILTEDTIYNDGLSAPGGLQADGYTVTLMADSDIATTTSGTSLSVTGGHTDLRGGALNDLNIGAEGSITIHKYMEAASLTKEEGGTLNVVEAFKAGNDLYVTNYKYSGGITVDTIINSGTLELGSGSALKLNNGTTQGGIVKAGVLRVSGDSTFTSLNIAGNTYTNGNTITLTGDSSLNYIYADAGATQATSLAVEAGHTTLEYGTLNDLSIAGGASLTLNGYVTTNTLTQEDGSTLIINQALNVGGTLYVTNYKYSGDMTVDTIINSGTLEVGHLKLNNGTTQGGIVKASVLSVSGDSTFTSLNIAGNTYTNGNTITLTGDSSLNYIFADAGATQATSLAVEAGHTTLEYGTLNDLSIAGGASLTLNGYVTTNTLTQEDGSTLIINQALNVGGTLYVTNYKYSGDITVDTIINSGTLELGSGKVLKLNNGTTQGGIVKASVLRVSGDSTFTSLNIEGNTYTNGNTITLTGDSSLNYIYADAGATQATSLAVEAGHTTLEYGTLHNLSVSEQGRLTHSGTLNVAGNIASCEAVGTLAEGLSSGIEASGNITVGTSTDGALKEGTGDVNLAGSLTSTG